MAMEGYAAVVATGVMTVELQKLRHKVVLLSAHNVISQGRVADVAYELHKQLQIPHWNITVLPQKLENILVWSDYPEQQDVALRISSISIGATSFLIHPWHLDTGTRLAS
jgi:hypothetical protein